MAIDVKAYRQKDIGDLHRELASLQRQHFDLRTQAVIEKLEDTSRLRKIRRDVARLKTLLRERELASVESAAPSA
jgi:large subunit ribosomal protein L29